MSKNPFLLYAITSQNWLGDKSLYQCVKEAIKGGITMLQIREKNCDTQTLIVMSFPIVELCRFNKIPCIINDNVYAAKVLKADGVHIGQNDMKISEARDILGKNFIIGTSAHNVKEAIDAQKQGADYIGCGAIFGSDTKQDASKLSYLELCAIKEAVTIPVVAIGGITYENADLLSKSKIDGIAVISAIFGEKNIEEASRRMLEKAKKL